MSISIAQLPPHALAAYETDTRALMAELGLAREDVLDLGLGDSSEPVVPFIRQALIEAVTTTTHYPAAAGLPALREAVAGWAGRRFGARLDPDTQVMPTQGSKEAIFSLAFVAREPGKDVVALTVPGYAIPERGARVAGLEPLPLTLDAAHDFLPDLDAIDEATWDRLAVFWVNYPNNPTGATAPRELYAELAERARHHGFVLASDEAYTELWWDEPTASVLELDSLENVVAYHSLSKRSGLTGYRTGFAAGDPALIAAARKYRSMAGGAATEFVQRAAAAAWVDEDHVAERRELIGAKRAVLRDGLEAAGLPVAGSRAGLFLWAAAPGGASDAFARTLLERGVAVVPGRYFGEGGEGWLRLAPVPSLEDCRVAAQRIEEAARAWTS
ncbi:MAG TPA: aminotransferase class I/II-fold pyridoxal phosphate-dependent enzyme [Solirubrobacteraceae bacterium]